jgi:hypothetical protein
MVRTILYPVVQMEVLRLNMTEAESEVFDSMTPEEQTIFILNQLEPEEKEHTYYDMILDRYKSGSLPRMSIEPGVCRECGCTQFDPCFHPDYGNCWLTNRGTLCSHCESELIRNDPETARPEGVRNPKF